MIALWKGKNPIYFGVISSKVKVTVTINIIFDNRVVSHDNFSSVYWIFTKPDHMIPLWNGKNPIYFGVKGQSHCYYKYNVWRQSHCYYKYNVWQQGRFRTITLVLYIGSLTYLATWFPCGRGRTLFILGSLPLYRLIIYIVGRILWCTHFLLYRVDPSHPHFYIVLIHSFNLFSTWIKLNYCSLHVKQ
jgi:hypothetical protein